MAGDLESRTRYEGHDDEEDKKEDVDVKIKGEKNLGLEMETS